MANHLPWPRAPSRRHPLSLIHSHSFTRSQRDLCRDTRCQQNPQRESLEPIGPGNRVEWSGAWFPEFCGDRCGFRKSCSRPQVKIEPGDQLIGDPRVSSWCILNPPSIKKQRNPSRPTLLSHTGPRELAFSLLSGSPVLQELQ